MRQLSSEETKYFVSVGDAYCDQYLYQLSVAPVSPACKMPCVLHADADTLLYLAVPQRVLQKNLITNVLVLVLHTSFVPNYCENILTQLQVPQHPPAQSVRA